MWLCIFLHQNTHALFSMLSWHYFVMDLWPFLKNVLNPTCASFFFFLLFFLFLLNPTCASFHNPPVPLYYPINSSGYSWPLLYLTCDSFYLLPVHSFVHYLCIVLYCILVLLLIYCMHASLSILPVSILYPTSASFCTVIVPPFAPYLSIVLYMTSALFGILPVTPLFFVLF